MIQPVFIRALLKVQTPSNSEGVINGGVVSEDALTLGPVAPPPPRLNTITTCNYIITLREHDYSFTDAVTYLESFCPDTSRPCSRPIA